jgi:hypothetical protein
MLSQITLKLDKFFCVKLCWFFPTSSFLFPYFFTQPNFLMFVLKVFPEIVRIYVKLVQDPVTESEQLNSTLLFEIVDLTR